MSFCEYQRQIERNHNFGSIRVAPWIRLFISKEISLEIFLVYFDFNKSNIDNIYRVFGNKHQAIVKYPIIYVKKWKEKHQYDRH